MELPGRLHRIPGKSQADVRTTRRRTCVHRARRYGLPGLRCPPRALCPPFRAPCAALGTPCSPFWTPCSPFRPAAIQRSARYRVDRLDPDGAAGRVRECRKARRVELRFTEDGMADLCAYLPADTACAIYARVDAIAKSDNSRRDERSLDAIRADVFTELLLGKRHSYRKVQIHVTVPVSTLFGARDLPGDLEGHGPIPADIAREMAADPTCTWRRLLTDPATGQLLEMGRQRYKPPAQLGD
ncbi:MAG: DUF222 domain-containing protein [Actinophytocola sp.]|nr:DUF222 domain-containing protein [Actinophytocola sp.]